MKTTLQPEAADLEAIRRETEARRAHRRLQRIMAAAHGELERHRFDQRPRRQLGGSMGLPLSMADPFWTRETASQMMRSPAGGLLSGTPGLPGVAGGMAGVAPGTEVAGLAMGSNPLSGARLGSGMTETRPYGIAAPRIVREGPGAPRPPSVPASVTNPSSGLTDTIDTLRGIGVMTVPRRRPEPRAGGRVKKAAKQQTVERSEEERRPLVTSPIANPNDWRPARPTKAQLMAGR